MVKKQGMRGGNVPGKVSKNQRDVAAKPPAPVVAPAKPTASVITAGTYDVPGGTIVVDAKGMSTYNGEPYRKIELKRKYRAWADDRDKSGKVRIKMK